MSNVVKKSDVQKMYPQRDTFSHKGENGRILIIGGSINYFGAPILAALGALGSGADLVYLLVPECNFEVSRSFYPDFIVRKYAGDFINEKTVAAAEELFEKVDCILMGPGVSEGPESLDAITKIAQMAPCPVVLDAEAIPAIAKLGLAQGSPQETEERAEKFTITPHRGEMDLITEGQLPDNLSEMIKIVNDFSRKWGVTILLKGHTDMIAAPNRQIILNETGNPGMTVGGTGDVLAGIVASLIAQQIPAYEACQCAAFLNGIAGDNLVRQKGFNFSGTDLALELPYSIYSILGR
ncbi:MAG: NAD(P)H-hydrate dehydratase [Candidatus Gracilibacteria bacterium]|jgi:NAD(P)H-hydrate epimerase